MRPSRKELFDRLREQEEATSWEKLARSLEIDSRRLTEWRKKPKEDRQRQWLDYEKTVELLDRAGYLNGSVAATPEADRLDQVAEAIEAAVEQLRAATALLHEAAAQPPSKAAGR